MKIVRDYLTSEELDYIVNAMLEKESALEREVVKVGLVAQLVGEDLGEFETCDDIYNKVVADSKINFDGIITNYYIIDKLYAEETSINKILKEFIEDISVKITKSVENLDLKGVVKELKEVANVKDNVSPTTTKKKGW